MTVLGHWVVLAACAASFGSAAFYGLAGGKGTFMRPARVLLGFALLLVILASALLTALLLSHDFSNGYVYSYSDRSLPVHFLLSSFYAGQEGSFLFWALCSLVLAVPLARFSHRHNNEAWVMSVFMLLQSVLLLLVVAKSPFRFFWEMIPNAPAGSVPPDGRGLNPLLQNFWMVIHPPVLFLGFAAMAAPFALALAGLWKRDYDILITQALPWVLLATGVLGAGIMLGGYWAYGVLGWGGYWGWDPVENSSLVPWITAMALVHTLLAQLRTGKFRRTSFFLALASFLLVVYSTFLTRSGILGDASVHSFTDPGTAVYMLLLGFLGLLVLAGGALLALRFREMKPAAGEMFWFSRETLLGAGALALVLIALVVLFGTSLPIFSTTRVEPSFYDRSNLPIAILMGLLIGLSLFAQWEDQDLRYSFRRATRSLLAALVATVPLVVLGVRDPLMVGFAFSAFLTLCANVEIGWAVAKGDPLFLGGKITHIGLALFFLGVLGSGRYMSTAHVSLPLGRPVEALGYAMTYTGNAQLTDGKFGFHVAVQHGDERFTLMPVMFQTESQGLLRNPDIGTTWTRDLYLSPVSLDPGEAPTEGENVTLEKEHSISVRDARITFRRFDMSPHASAQDASPAGMAIGAVLEISRGLQKETVTPVTVFRSGGTPSYRDAPSVVLRGPVRLAAINAGGAGAPSSIALNLPPSDGAATAAEVLVVEASVKPFIGLVWGGTVVMMIGFALSCVKRLKEVRA